MDDLFKVIDLNDKEKIGNLESKAHSKVKSTKYFPIYKINGKQMIFKPLSKTKPLTTPFFAYSEVYWSYIINKYFDSNTPRYYLAKTNDNLESKYYNKGVLVESITPNGEELINIYDYFLKYPEDSVDIKSYTNYCMVNYDYTKILQSNFIKNNQKIGEELAYQILLSILRMDQNFHYENVNFINNQELVIAPPIDFEFSTPFLYPDKIDEYNNTFFNYKNSINIKYEEDEELVVLRFIQEQTGSIMIGKNQMNILLILKMYPNVVIRFIKNLEVLINDLPNIKLSDNDNYISLLNSDYWKVGHALYKECDKEKYEQLKDKIILNEINKEKVFNKITSDILEFSKSLMLTLKIYLTSYNLGIEKLEYLTIKQLLNKLNINDNVTIEDIDIDIDIDTKQLKLTKK